MLLKMLNKLLRKNSIILSLICGILFLLSFLVIVPAHADGVNISNQDVFDCTWAGFSRAMFVPTTCNSGLGNITSGQADSAQNMPSNLKSYLQTNGLSPSSYFNGGAVGMLSQVAQFSTSASGDYGNQAVTYVAEKFSPTVSAQSSAIQGLSPVLILHGIGRNIAYVLIAIALVVIGLSTFFAKNSGKQEGNPAVANISDIVICLIFVTISFPVGGVVIDLVINLGNYVVASLFQPFINSQDILSNLYTPGSGTSVISLLSDFQNSGSSPSVISLVQAGLSNLQFPLDKSNEFLQNITSGVLNKSNTPLLTTNVPFTNINGIGIFSGLVSIIYSVASGLTTTAISNPLITAIIAFTVFIIIFRVVFGLLAAFVGIIMILAFSPFILIPGAFPGVSATSSFSGWIKRLVGLSLVFPITFAILLLSAIFLNINKSSTFTGSCQYDPSSPSSPSITGSYANNKTGTTSGTGAKVFDTTRFQPSTSAPNNTDPYSSTRACYPILLPPQFNWLPAPLGNLGNQFSIDDFTRFVVGIALLIMLPNINKIIQDALKIKNPNYATIQDALVGAGLLSTFVGIIPVIGQPISRLTSELTKSIK